MKKRSNKSKNKPLKTLRKEIEECFSLNKFNEAKQKSEKIMKLYPKNILGYKYYLKAATENYSKYVNDEELKKIKNIFDLAYDIANKQEKIVIKKDFDDYFYDIKETSNLSKIKKDIIGKEFLKLLYNDKLKLMNQNINITKEYDENGIKIKNIYDFINGLFLISCLIFNLIFRNYLLILTIPFGVFGIINIYSFIDKNFFVKEKNKKEKNDYDIVIKDALQRLSELKSEIKKIENSLIFLYDQKKISISKLPETFKKDINDLILSDEVNYATNLLNCLSQKNMVCFNTLLVNKTNLSVDYVSDKINQFSIDDEVLNNFINAKNIERKNKKNKLIYIQKIKPINIIILVITLLISILSIFILINNFYELNFISFIISFVSGFISMLIYNVETGKCSSVKDTFNDNLLSSVFSATLVYDLIYSSITDELKFTYGFIQMPITFILIFIGFVMLISILKYHHMFKKLSK